MPPNQMYEIQTSPHQQPERKRAPGGLFRPPPAAAVAEKEPPPGGRPNTQGKGAGGDDGPPA
eukprot:gene11442-20276_t